MSPASTASAESFPDHNMNIEHTGRTQPTSGPDTTADEQLLIEPIDLLRREPTQLDPTQVGHDVVGDAGSVSVESGRLHPCLDDRKPMIDQPLLEQHRARLDIEPGGQFMD